MLLANLLTDQCHEKPWARKSLRRLTTAVSISRKDGNAFITDNLMKRLGNTVLNTLLE